ncbi:MAG: RNA-guided endonuclease InsQ/TnpB family protein, partial [Cetobacterium sp.]
LKPEFEFLKEVDSLALANVQMNVKVAFTNFFQKRTAFPRYKSKKTARKSYTTNSVNNSIRIEGNSIKLPKLGWVKIKLHRAIPQNYIIKSATISQEPNGAFYVSVLTEFLADIVPVPSDNNIVGLDFSMKELFVSSENQRADYPRFFRKLEAKLAKAGKELSRKVKFSSNWSKAKLKVAKIHQSIKNSRKDFLHKLSIELVTKYNAIIIEDLNMRGMSGALNFGKSVADNGWGNFTVMLKYKAMFCGKQVIKIDKWFPSSKTCSICGNIKTELALSERVYKCEHCNSEIDRDLNASINIREAGRTLLAY